jgi:AAA family ATP:ADP antiporter
LGLSGIAPWAIALVLRSLRLTRTAGKFAIAREPVLAAVKREVRLERRLWEHKHPLEIAEDAGEADFSDAFLRDRTSRALEHVFAILSLIFEREPMRLALRALSGDDETLRGTALEYLEQVLPADLKAPLWPFLAQPEQPTTVKN